jgi:hypothetical protein
MSLGVAEVADGTCPNAGGTSIATMVAASQPSLGETGVVPQDLARWEGCGQFKTRQRRETSIEIPLVTSLS